MQSHYVPTILKSALCATVLLLLGVTMAVGQQQVNLTAGPTSVTMPDGSVVPMWGYTCGTVVTSSAATCAALNPAPTGWSPVVITVPTGAAGGLTINLTNNLLFANGNTVPTSLVIVGQLGAGLGSTAKPVASPAHGTQDTTWPIAAAGAQNVPPPQGSRVQSFSTEVAEGTTTALTWPTLRPGTYLIESGTHPSIQGPMGLYGILVVTTAPAGTNAGTAYPGVAYNAEVPLLLSEIDPVQNASVNQAVNTVGFSETEVWSRQPGVNAGPVTSIALNNPGALYTLPPVVAVIGSGSNATAVATISGGLVTGITLTNAGDGYAPCTGLVTTACPNPTNVTITPATGAITGSGATATATVTLGGCGGGAHTCYPPAVNYTPLYYTINGVAFNRNAAAASSFPVSPASGVSGSVLVRLVNAGLRMPVP